MNAIPAQDIKRRGMSAVDALLAKGPVHVIRNNRPRYVILTEDDYSKLTRSASIPANTSAGDSIPRQNIWDFLLSPRPWVGTRSKEDIDAQIAEERDSWGEEDPRP
ncbi:MAG: type II toxin-antitoxin system Phd/YefM family antitoxin [Pseudomonadota bacterium]